MKDTARVMHVDTFQAEDGLRCTARIDSRWPKKLPHTELGIITVDTAPGPDDIPELWGLAVADAGYRFYSKVRIADGGRRFTVRVIPREKFSSFL